METIGIVGVTQGLYRARDYIGDYRVYIGGI